MHICIKVRFIGDDITVYVIRSSISEVLESKTVIAAVIYCSTYISYNQHDIFSVYRHIIQLTVLL